MKRVLEVVLLLNIMAFVVIPLILMYTNGMAYVDYMILIESPLVTLFIFIGVLGLSVYGLKTIDAKLSSGRRTLLSIMVMVSIVVILVQLYLIFVLG